MTKLMLIGLVLLLSSSVLAHDPGLSAVEVRILPDRIVAEVSFSPLDLERLPHLASNDIAQHLLSLKCDQEILKLKDSTVQTTDANSIHFILEFPNSSGTELHLSAIALEHLPRGHKQFLAVRDANGKLLIERMLSAESKDFTIPLQINSTSKSESFLRFLLLGIEHIFTGYDHLAFLLAVLLTKGSLWSNARIITSFTLAHSLTLALATFGVFTLPPSIVEPLIAASIVFVGIENLVRRQLAQRWLVTFGFGLIHGLGFASILRELGIGSMGVQGAIPLLSFNLGVELAQISIAALILPLVWKLQRRPSFMLKQAPASALHKKSKQSAKGAEYESQGQARSEAERVVAPGKTKRSDPALKARNTRDISAFQASFDRAYRNQGRRASLCSALAPGFHIPRLWRSVSTFCEKHPPLSLLITFAGLYWLLTRTLVQ
jgi:hydrogenase/urease accessory protein HupE